MAQVFLPCESQRWPEEKEYFDLLSKIRSAEELDQIVKENSGFSDENVEKTSQRLSCLQGLCVFLNEIATEEEREVFFTSTLSFICRSASCLDMLVPERGVPFLRQQEGASVFLGRKLVLSLLANAFLCTFPHEHPLGKKAKPFSFYKFFKVFRSGDKSRVKPQAAKLRCFLNYFNRMSFHGEEGAPGTICFTRQAIANEELPSLSDWRNCEYPLCNISVDNDRKIEDAGSRTLQVDFAAAHIGGGVLGGGKVQEEIRFCICPELVVSMLINDVMEDNEAIVITGHERFSSYYGYATTLNYGGDFQDPSERDIYGNLNTALTAINAIPYQGSNGEEQYQEENVLRDLNKAFVGFLCRDERGDVSLQNVPIRQGEYIEEEGEDLSMYETTSQMTWDDSPLGEHENVEAYSLSLSSDIIGHVVRAIRNEGSEEEEKEGEIEGERDVEDSLRHMASSLVKNVMDDVLKTKQEDGFDSFSADTAASILTSVKQDLLFSNGSVALAAAPSPVQTQGLASSDQEGTPRSRSSSYTGQPLLPIEYTDTVVEEAINKGIDEAFQSEHLMPLPLPTLQVNIEDTEKEEGTPTVMEPMGFADKLATNILGSASPTSPAKKTVVSLSSAGGGAGEPKKPPLKLGGKSQKPKSRQSGNPRRSFPWSSSNSTDGIDILDPRSLNPPSSRMSIAWSTTSTRGEDSMPTSPTELDHIAIRMVNNINDLATVLTDLVIRDAIQACALPQEISDHLSINQYDKEQVSSSKGMTKIDTFLQSLHEAESQVSLDVPPSMGLLPFSLPLHEVRKGILRPVATGNWGCGAFKGDPQLKSMLQWMAVSASGRPEMKYHPFNEKRLQQLPEITDKFFSSGTTVGQLCQLIAQYCTLRRDNFHQEDLFTFLLKN